MRDKDYEAEFAPTRWYHYVGSFPFLVLGKTIELTIRTLCLVKGHKVLQFPPDYCQRCHRYLDD